MHVIISGLGLMGASLSMALRRNLNSITISGYDLPEIMDEAISMKIIDKKIVQWPFECKSVDIIFLATPLRTIKKHIIDLKDVIERDTIVTDLGSTKSELYDLVNSIEFPGIYIGGHPMTGAEKSGIKAANPLLYENAVYILTDTKVDRNPIVKQKLLPALTAIKSRILLMDPIIHDQIVALISHLPQVIAISLVKLVGEKNSANLPYFELAAGGFRDLTRIASGSVNIWQDIFSSNKENIQNVIDELMIILGKIRNNIDNISSELDNVNKYRSQLPKKTKGFLSPLTDVMVYVNDQVGVIAKISNALSEKKIDIRDIELLKIREKEGGVFRLSFSNLDEAQEAIKILETINYQAFIRE